MGFFDTILGFGKNKTGKIVTFSLIGFGTLIFFVGILMTALGSAVVTPKEFKLIAPNMEYKKDFWVGGKNLTGYHLTVTEKQTSITVQTPSGTTAPATFLVSSGSNHVSITKEVPSNGTAILELKKVNGAYNFHDPNDPLSDLNKIVIDVTFEKSHQVTQIFVRVVLSPEHVELVATLDKQNNHGEWNNPTEYFDMVDFNPRFEPEDGFLNYRINATLKIFGDPVYTLEDHPDNVKFEATEVFTEEDDIDFFSDIKLLGNSQERHKDRCRCFDENSCRCCDKICTCIDSPFITATTEYVSYFFKVSCTFEIGQSSNMLPIEFTCFTIPDFELKIKIWNGK